ncbi:MAG: c-type cytochrome biogenesis protein CcmI/CycH [Nitrospirota bacterium]
MSVRSLVLALVLSATTVVAGTGCYKQSEPPKPATLSGSVTVAPELAKDITPEHILFIVVRPADAPPFGPPVAAHKMTNLTFPVQYEVSQKDVFFEGVTLEGKVNVYAKLDKDGNAGPPEPGDLEGEFKGNPIMVGATGVDIVVDKIH